MRAQVWLSEQEIRPRAWLDNFEPCDQLVAAVLLDHFCFYADRHTNRLLSAAYNSLLDGLPKGPDAPNRDQIARDLSQAIFTRVEGEDPRPTDSGNLFCRKARQRLSIPDDRFMEPADAIQAAGAGRPIVFLDDFVGSGDQFLRTWERPYGRSKTAFSEVMTSQPFTAIYVVLVATNYGLNSTLSYSSDWS